MKTPETKYNELKNIFKESFFLRLSFTIFEKLELPFPFSSLSEVDKVEATVKGILVFSLILTLYTNIGKVSSGQTYFSSIFISNSIWLGTA